MTDFILYKSLREKLYNPMKSNMRNETSDSEIRPPKFRRAELQNSASWVRLCCRESYSSPSGRMGGVIIFVIKR
jgi:hypothetical protein